MDRGSERKSEWMTKWVKRLALHCEFIASERITRPTVKRREESDSLPCARLACKEMDGGDKEKTGCDRTEGWAVLVPTCLRMLCGGSWSRHGTSGATPHVQCKSVRPWVTQTRGGGRCGIGHVAGWGGGMSVPGWHGQGGGRAREPRSTTRGGRGTCPCQGGTDKAWLGAGGAAQGAGLSRPGWLGLGASVRWMTGVGTHVARRDIHGAKNGISPHRPPKLPIPSSKVSNMAKTPRTVATKPPKFLRKKNRVLQKYTCVLCQQGIEETLQRFLAMPLCSGMLGSALSRPIGLSAMDALQYIKDYLNLPFALEIIILACWSLWITRKQ